MMSKDEGLLATNLGKQTFLIHLLSSCQKFSHVSLYIALPYPLRSFPQDIYEIQIYFSFNTRKYEEIFEINPCLSHHDWKVGSFLSPQECWLTREEESVKYVKWTTHAHFLFSSLLTIYSCHYSCMYQSFILNCLSQMQITSFSFLGTRCRFQYRKCVVGSLQFDICICIQASNFKNFAYGLSIIIYTANSWRSKYFCLANVSMNQYQFR